MGRLKSTALLDIAGYIEINRYIHYIQMIYMVICMVQYHIMHGFAFLSNMYWKRSTSQTSFATFNLRFFFEVFSNSALCRGTVPTMCVALVVAKLWRHTHLISPVRKHGLGGSLSCFQRTDDIPVCERGVRFEDIQIIYDHII